MKSKPKKKSYRNSVFVVVYVLDRESNKPIYLLLKRKLHWNGWEFTKGGVEKKETLKEAVAREVKEETGLRATKIKLYGVNGKYNYDKVYEERSPHIGQKYTLFSAEVKCSKGKDKNTKVKLDKKEHSAYKWVSYTTALKMLTWPNQRKSMRIVNKIIENKNNL